MTKDDIMRMAREAGLHSAVLLRIYDDKEAALCDSEIAELRKIERFANLVAAAERDVLLRQIRHWGLTTLDIDLVAYIDAIRARGTT